MAEHLFIVHGWSDIGFSFQPLINYLTTNNLYQHHNIRLINYDSLDDQTIFEDFADKLDEIFEKYKQEKNIERIDVLCHSTGSLVVRAWLALRRKRQLRRKQNLDVPVEHFFLFAPANFGSDLAKLGRSTLNRLRFTFRVFTNDGVQTQTLEVGAKILEGLEPASPDQWRLSHIDLHEETYFGPNDPSGKACYPFVFAAGRFNESFLQRFVRQTVKPGTDSTVRICGTSLNTRKYTLRLVSNLPPQVEISQEHKFNNIAFAVFHQYDHGSIIKESEPNSTILSAQWQPGSLLKEAKNVKTVAEYNAVAEKFGQQNDSNYQAAKNNPKLTQFAEQYQQFFFKVYDDTLLPVKDYDIDFFVRDLSIAKNQDPEQIDQELSRQVDHIFEKDGWYVHSVDRSGSVLMVNHTKLESFLNNLKKDSGKQLILKINATSPHKGVFFESQELVVFGNNSDHLNTDDVKFLCPNTTTLVEVIIDRKIRNQVLNIV